MFSKGERMKLFKQQRKEEIAQYRKKHGSDGGTVTSTENHKVTKAEKIDAQWKLATLLAISKWKKLHVDDKRSDGELTEQWMREAANEGWCRKGSEGKWELRELKLNKKKMLEELKELGVIIEEERPQTE
jgi:hypothetical protein